MGKVKSTKEEKVQLKHDNFLKRLEDAFPNEYTVLAQYLGTDKKLKIRHNECEYEWEVHPGYLFVCHKNGKRCCPRCSGKAIITQEEFEKRVANLDDNFEVLGEVNGVHGRVKVRHVDCNYEWYPTPASLVIHGKKCPRCQKRERYTTDDFREKLKEITNGEYEILEDYINNREKVKFKHIKCGTVFKESPARFLQDEMSCTCCKEISSKGERKIEYYLNDKGINYSTQQTFDDCKNIRSLRFDFSILSDKKVIALIEFDGKQHFEPIEWFGGEEEFESTKHRDQIKNEYCKDKNIPLLRIPYWQEDSIESVLFEFIRKINSIKLN